VWYQGGVHQSRLRAWGSYLVQNDLVGRKMNSGHDGEKTSKVKTLSKDGVAAENVRSGSGVFRRDILLPA